MHERGGDEVQARLNLNQKERAMLKSITRIFPDWLLMLLAGKASPRS